MNKATDITKMIEGTNVHNTTSIHIGDKFDLQEVDIEVLDIFVEDAHLSNPHTMVSYFYKFKSGKKLGKEKNLLSFFLNNILRDGK